MAQPLLWIIANRRCTTHRPGTVIDFTGPRSTIPKGWTFGGRVRGAFWQPPDGFTIHY